VTNQYHNPLAVEPESAKDAARKIKLLIFQGTVPADLTAQAEQ
jgi:hypothetical protein